MGVASASNLLLERDAELTSFRRALDSARSGRGTITVVVGPAGGGKSRLLEEAAHIAQGEGIMSLRARASEFERDLPFGVAARLIGRRGGGLIRAEEESADVSFAMMERFRDTLLDVVHRRAGESGTVLVLVDDLQWADGSSLRCIWHTLLSLDDLPVAFVGAVREGETGPADSPLRALLADPRTSVLTPQPLSRSAVAQVVHAACGPTEEALVDACTRVTGGNPFYLVELVRELRRNDVPPTVEMVEGAAPETVLRSLMARLAHLGPAAAQLASALAVIGDGAGLAMVADLAGLTISEAEAAADALARADFVTPGEPMSFTHPLIASTLRSDMGVFALSRAHRRAAELLARNGAPVERIAAHLLHSRPEGDSRVVAWLREAARVAAARGEPQLAERLLARALEEPPLDAERGPVLLQLAEAEVQAGSPRALGHLRDALELIDDVQPRAEARLALARTLHHAGEFAEEAALAEQCRAELPPDHPLQERALSTWASAALLYPPLRNEQVPQTMAQLLEDVRAGRPPSDPALLALLASWVVSFDEPGELVAGLAQAAFTGGPMVDGDSRGTALGYAAFAMVSVDALDLAAPLLDDAVDEAQRRGAAIALSITCHYRAQLNLLRGRLAVARVDAERSLEIYRQGWAGSAWSTPTLVLILVELGDLTRASAVLGAGGRVERDRAEWPIWLEARAQLRLAQGRAAEALADAKAAGAHTEAQFGVTSCRVFDWVRIAALAAHRAGCGAEAQEFANEALRRGQAANGRHLGTALAAAGIVAGGRRGVDLLAEACHVLEASPSCLERARAQLELGRARRRLGQVRDAAEPLYSALELAGSMGAVALVEGARSELARLGLRPRRAARAGVWSLTPMEQRVAEMASRGLTTREVADELVLNPKTVEGHLTHVYGKLGIKGRDQLAEKLNGAAESEEPGQRG